MAKERRAPVAVERPVDLRGMKSLNELQRREVTVFVEHCFEVLAEQLQRDHDARYWRKPAWWLKLTGKA